MGYHYVFPPKGPRSDPTFVLISRATLENPMTTSGKLKSAALNLNSAVRLGMFDA
jgi:hypothetical protein